MEIISYVTHYNRETYNLEKSLQKYNYNYKFLGISDKWEGFVKSKIFSLYHYLKFNCSNDIVCIIDGYDMLACDYPNILLQKYKNMNIDIVYGGEKFCLKYNGTHIEKYNNISILSCRKFANGGFCIGKKDEIIKLYKWIMEQYNKYKINDDQKLIGQYINKFPNKFSIDLYQTIVFNTITTFDIENFEVVNNKIKIKSFSSFPCFIHFPSSISDDHKRYNRYGKVILKKDFKRIYNVKFVENLNIFSNLNFYLFYLFLMLIFFCLFFKIKYVLLIFFIVLCTIIKLKVQF